MLRAVYVILCALSVLATASAPALAAPPAQESAAERRAVRGTPVDTTTLTESPELREVRRFEEDAFPRAGLPPTRAADDQPAALPPGLDAGGRWGGTGDIPAQLRSPENLRRPGRLAPAPDAAWLRSLRLPELPVRWEPQLIRYLEYFKNDPRGRAIMAGWVRRQGRYRALFDRILDRHGLPRDLIYLAMIESGYEPGAVSRVGAGGVWQFMPGVARAYGLEVSHWVDARRDPERAADAAARYLKDLHVRFGSWYLAFAAYHAGYGGILRSITRFNSNDYWELCRHEAGLPWETTLYVPKILAAAIVGYNLQAFGFGDVAPDPPWAYDRVEAPPGTTLATVARATGTRVEDIQSLNPELVRARTPPDRGALALRVPPGAAPAYASAIEKARSATDRVETVVLRFGESLEDLARERGLSVRELKKLNGAKEAAELRAGAAVVVPVRGGERAALARATATATGGAGEGDGDGDGATADDVVLVAVPERTFSYQGRERVFYRTRDGDTLEEIAGVFRVPVEEIVEWNNLDPDAKLHGKLVLQLYVHKELDRAAVALLDPAKVRVVTLGSQEFLALETARRGKTRLQYTARSGDTLAKIARRYGLQPGDLARINKLSYSSALDEGQKVVVYSPTPELPREASVGRAGPTRRPAAGPGPGPAKPAGKGGGPVKATPVKATAPAKAAAAKPAARKPEGRTQAAAATTRSAGGKTPVKSSPAGAPASQKKK